MTPTLIVAGLVLLALPGWSRRSRLGLDVVRWTRVCRAALVLGLGATLVGFLLWAAPVVLHLVDGWGVPGLCDDAIHQLPLGGLEFALGAMAAGGWIIARMMVVVVRSARRSRDARVDHFIGRHRDCSEFDVVVIPSPKLVAVGVPGARPQIVISEGLVSVLEPPEVNAVLRHEMAHHRLGHRSYLVLAAAVDHVFGWLPPVRSSTGALRDAVEEWADLESTRRVPARVAGLRSALARLADVHGTTAARRDLERRLAILESPTWGKPSQSGVALGFVVGLIGATVAASLLLGGSVQLMATVGGCPT